MIAVAVFFLAIGFVLGVAAVLAFHGPRLRRLQRRVDQLTSGEAFEASRPRELVQLRHCSSKGRTYSVHDRKIEDVADLIRCWAHLSPTPIILDPDDELQGWLLRDPLDCDLLFTIRAAPARVPA